MFKNKTELQKKEIHKYTSVDFISQELSKKLETELQKFVTYYNG